MSRLERIIRFVAVAEELSFSRAARRLNVDQPWLSRQIQQLEGDLGFPLFIRNTRKVELTAKGVVLYEQAREIAATVDKTLDTVRALGRSDVTGVTVGVQPFSFWLPSRQRLLGRFQAAHPETHVRLISNYTPRLISKIRRRTVDVAIVPGPLNAMSDLEAVRISQQKLRILIPIEDPLARRRSISVSDMAGKKIVTFDPRLSPTIYQARYGPLIAAGASPVISPDGDLGLYYMAKMNRLVLPAFDWPDADKILLQDFIQANTQPGFPTADHWLVRRKECDSRAVDWMWRLAQEIHAEFSPAVADSTPAQGPDGCCQPKLARR